MEEPLRRRLLVSGADRQDAETAAPSRSVFRRLRLRGGDDGESCCVVVCFLLAVFVFAFISTLKPNEYGLKLNYYDGNVSYHAYRGQWHVLGPLKTFVRFPAAQITLEYSKAYLADRPPVQTRTGADTTADESESDERESGGQPIEISCALQFAFEPSKLMDVYLNFGSYEEAKERYLLWAGNMVGNAAQDFTPQDFWTRRDYVAKKMLMKVNHTLWDQGFVEVKQFEIIAIDFVNSFEQSITQVQVAEQRKVINKYDQKVKEVEQHIQVIKSENEAIIANITAEADATAKKVCAAAKRDAFKRKQSTKAKYYAELKTKLELNDNQMAQYLKIKALQGQESSGKVVVGLPSIGESAAVPPKAVGPKS